jgi:hypothetical protein
MSHQLKSKRALVTGGIHRHVENTMKRASRNRRFGATKRFVRESLSDQSRPDQGTSR